MQIYCTVDGELAVLREDRGFDALLAEEIIDRAGLNPGGSDNPDDLLKLPLHKDATYTWQ